MDIDIKSGFNNLSSLTQHALCVAGIVIVAVVAYLYFLQPKNEELAALTAKNDQLQEEVARGTAVETRYKEFQQKLDESRERLRNLEKLLPKEKEAAVFLRDIQKMATDSSLKINLFKPQEMATHEFYSDWPISIKVEGNYHGLGSFFEKISLAERIVDVPTLSIQNITDQTDTRRTIIATGVATTYVQGVDQPQTEQTEGTK